FRSLEGLERRGERRGLAPEGDADAARAAEVAAAGDRQAEALAGEGGEAIALVGPRELAPGGVAGGRRAGEARIAPGEAREGRVILGQDGVGARPQRVEVREQGERQRGARPR